MSSGGRPGVLKEPEPPVMLEHAVCPCSGAPSLEMPSLASSGNVIEKATLSSLAAEAAQAELDKRKRKEERRRKMWRSALQEEAAEAMQRARLLVDQAAKRRKRKKRRKRRTPRTSSCSLQARFAVLVGRPWAGRYGPEVLIVQYAGFTGDDAPRAVLLFFVVRPKVLCSMAGMTQKDSCL